MWVYLDLNGAIDLLSGWVGGRWLRAGAGRQCMGAGGVAGTKGGGGVVLRWWGNAYLLRNAIAVTYVTLC